MSNGNESGKQPVKASAV